MRRHTVGLLVILAFGLLVASVAAEAPPRGHLPRLGILHPWAPPTEGVSALQQGLRELGYVEGQTIAIEARYVEWRDERPPSG